MDWTPWDGDGIKDRNAMYTWGLGMWLRVRDGHVPGEERVELSGYGKISKRSKFCVSALCTLSLDPEPRP